MRSVADDTLRLGIKEGAAVGSVYLYGAFGCTTKFAVVPISYSDEYLCAVLISELYIIVVGNCEDGV